MNKSEQINELATSLAKAQRTIRNAIKDQENPFYHSTYADLASVWDACREPLADNGLSVVQSPEYSADETNVVIIETMLIHSSGQWISSVLKGIPVKEVNKDGKREEVESRTPQAIGSCITYLRRYALAAFVGVAPEDDDGNVASGKAEGAEVEKREFPISKLKCPKCGRVGSVIKGRAEYGGGYVCWAKQDPEHKKSCGAKFADNDADLLKQMGAESPVAKKEEPKSEPEQKKEAKPDDEIPPKRSEVIFQTCKLAACTDAHLAICLAKMLGVQIDAPQDATKFLGTVEPKKLDAALAAVLLFARKYKIKARPVFLGESNDEAMVAELKALYESRV